MRNVAVQDLVLKCPPDLFGQIGLGGKCAIDVDTNAVYVCTSPTQIYVFNALDKTIGDMIVLDDHTPSAILDIHYRIDEMNLCIITRSGEMLSWSSAEGLQNVGYIGENEELESVAWSPDGEIVIVLTAAPSCTVYILVCHGCDLDYVASFPFSQTEFGQAANVSVGWGKKETQFHGSVGKEAAKATELIEHKLASLDDRSLRVRWRGDGEYFAVSALDEIAACRKLRVWSREGVLFSTSESLTGLETALAWRPSGNLIASSQTDKNKHQIVFFERNGLRHGEFTLPYPINTVKVRELQWNTQSNMFCVWLQNLNQPEHIVEIWTMNNYHWYLKKSINFKQESKLPVQVFWDELEAYKLYIFSADGALLSYTLNWSVSRRSGGDTEVAVIDGDKLLMTTMRTMVVPPPMCSYEISLPSPADLVTFSPSNRMAVVLPDARLLVYALGQDRGDEAVKLAAAGGTGFKSKTALASHMASYTLPSENAYHLTWPLDEALLYVTCHPTEGAQLIHCHIEPGQLNVVCVLPVGKVVSSCPSHNGVFLQYSDSSVWKYDVQTKELRRYVLSSGAPLGFPVACQQLGVCTFAEQEAVVGLSAQFRLFVNEFELATNCTSFVVHGDFLLLTTHSHTLRCINRNTPLNKLRSLSDGKTHIFDETVRRVERGSTIVTCSAASTQLVLQMPRGNLEVIHPRALVLSTVRHHLDNLEYKEAFRLCYRHRLNMNVLCDHDLTRFLSNITTFVTEISSTAHLNQFLTELHADDVTQTMYTAFYGERRRPAGPNKLDTVCDALIRVFTDLDSRRYLLSMLTAHVRKSEPELERALHIIQQLQDPPERDEAIKYLMFLVDVNELYDVALGSYDFQLVMLVAEKSQKDPKEYLLFLNEVRKMETNYQKFYIDRHLKRHSKALSHIITCGPGKISEMLTHVEQHSLYLEALLLLAPESQAHQEVLILFAKHLESKRSHAEAATLYFQALEFRSALSCYSESLSWNEAIVCVNKLNMAPSEKLTVYKTLSDRLISRHRHVEAALLMENYAEQPEESITILISGREWSSALRLIDKYQRHDFLETDWKPAIETAHQEMMSSLERDRGELERFRDRFLVVQQANRARLELIDGEYRDIDADIYSDTSSMTGASTVSSSQSRSTGRTSKNLRKAQRKKWSLKEGSKHEDLALLDEMKKLIARFDTMRDEVHALLLALVHTQAWSKARSLQHTFQAGCECVLGVIPQVWTEALVSSASQAMGENSTAAGILQSMSKMNVSSPNPQATKAEIEVKRKAVFSTDSTWKLDMLQ